MKEPLFIDTIEACVDYILDTVPGSVVLGIPLGIGKPNPLVNALYRRIRANPARKLRIITALSLERPVGHSDLEKNFLQPLVMGKSAEGRWIVGRKRRNCAMGQYRPSFQTGHLVQHRNPAGYFAGRCRPNSRCR